jgi:tetratricopeptide (TPR) repeat protein
VEGAEELTAVGGEPLRLRVGINTGEALVRLGASAGLGERVLSGDAINTASRLQSVAPENGVAVGLATYEATAAVFDYQELEPATLKGKAEPVRVFHAMTARARFGTDLTRTHDTPFVGREIDLALLKGIFDKTVASSSVQLVTVVGEPGLGKSRIVAELSAYVDSRPELVTWRQGRCLPYGEGITFWALGEILKAHTGILESDPSDVAQEKLAAVLPESDEREWFRQRLLPLLGIEASSSAEREELFTAWRRFLEQVAERDPTVLVFEDLHWADEAMLAFLEHLADLAEGVPLLLVGTARPELYERHPDYAMRLRNATPINLQPLSQEETARLVSALLESTVLPLELQQPILDRAGGNPLYAEEFVRLLKDRDLLERVGSSWQLKEGAEVPFPESVQALIAARLDTLEPDAKSLLADAAVIGKVFWAGAVAAMGERDLQTVITTLRELSRKELVRPARQSSMAGEAEYAFWHILARDVAYNQLPRASRANRHVAAAAWIESKAPERVEDLADVLAYHYSTALDLARAAGQTDQAAELEPPALRFLGLAGERALGMDTAAALASFQRALALTPPGHPERAAALARYGEAALDGGRFDDAKEANEEALDLFRARGDLTAVARTLKSLGATFFRFGDSARRAELRDEALAILETLPPGDELIEALATRGGREVMMGRPEAALGHIERALALAREHDLYTGDVIGLLGLVRGALGEAAGLEDVRASIVLATQADKGQDVASGYLNLGASIWLFEGPAAAVRVLREGIAFAQARGFAPTVSWMTLGMFEALVELGEVDQALAGAEGYIGRLQGGADVVDLVMARTLLAWILALRGRSEQLTAASLDWLETNARGLQEPQWLILALGASALARLALGQAPAAAALLSEVEAYPGARKDPNYVIALPSTVRTALALDQPELAERLVAGVEPRWPYSEHALVSANAALAEAQGDLAGAVEGYADAARRWQSFGVVPEHAFALLGQGRCLTALGRTSEATPVLHQARDIFTRLQAAPALGEVDQLLGQATALSS